MFLEVQVCCMAGIRPAEKKALLQERRLLQSQEEFPCKETRKLNDAVALRYMRGSRSSGSWSRLGSWMSKFFAFANNICRSAGKSRTKDQCAASNVMCRHFIAHIAGEEKGATRARSARAALSKYRTRRGWQSLSVDKSISDIVAAVEAANPRTKRQSAGLTAQMVHYVVDKWGASKSWWQRQIATMICLGFVSIMRLGEIRSLQRKGVRLVFADGSERGLHAMRGFPALSKVAAVLLHLPWRKNHVAMDCWVPVACKTTIKLLLRQVQTLRAHSCGNTSLFPSRVYRTKSKQSFNAANWIGEQTFVKTMQAALIQCVPLMTHEWSKLYTGHALRVGGSNRMRRLGVADDIHRKLGGWMCLTSAQGYMALTPREQFAYTLRLAQKQTRVAGLSRDRAQQALPNIMCL